MAAVPPTLTWTGGFPLPCLQLHCSSVEALWSSNCAGGLACGADGGRQAARRTGRALDPHRPRGWQVQRAARPAAFCSREHCERRTRTTTKRKLACPALLSRACPPSKRSRNRLVGPRLFLPAGELLPFLAYNFLMSYAVQNKAAATRTIDHRFWWSARLRSGRSPS